MSRARLKDASNHNKPKSDLRGSVGISKSEFGKYREFKGEIQSISSRLFNMLAYNFS